MSRRFCLMHHRKIFFHYLRKWRERLLGKSVSEVYVVVQAAGVLLTSYARVWSRWLLRLTGPPVLAKYAQTCRQRSTCRAHLLNLYTICFLQKMHNIISRVNNVSAFMSSCVMVLLAAITLTTFLFNANPQGDLTISSIKVLVCS